MINATELGRRLRAARDACGLTQDEVADELGISRSAVAQIELGNRSVAGLELAKLAFLFGSDMRELLADEYVAERDPLGALFRANGDVSQDPKVTRRLRECIALGRELTHLEELLGFDRESAIAASYPLPQPRTKWEAIEQGARVADEERRRLGLGQTPIPDLVELLETQGVRTAIASLPEDVSGLTLSDKRTGLFVVANADHHVLRRRFSLAHEYAHILVDRERFGLISRTSQHDDLIEMRANSFAATLLMPAEGVRLFLANLGKGRPTRAQLDIFDDQGVAVEVVEARADPQTQAVQPYDVIHLAHHFGVSGSMALYRLKSLRFLVPSEVERLKPVIEERGAALRRILQLPEPAHADERNAFRHRFVSLGLEALRREVISKAKLVELARMVDVRPNQVEQLLREFELETEPVPVVIPDDG